MISRKALRTSACFVLAPLAALALMPACASDDSAPVEASSGIDGSLTTDALTESETSHLCDWSVGRLGGAGTKYHAPCVADAPAGTAVDMIVLTSTECTRRLLAYKTPAYTVKQFEDCTRAFVDGECGGGCISFSIDYPEDAGTQSL